MLTNGDMVHNTKTSQLLFHFSFGTSDPPTGVSGCLLFVGLFLQMLGKNWPTTQTIRELTIFTLFKTSIVFVFPRESNDLDSLSLTGSSPSYSLLTATSFTTHSEGQYYKLDFNRNIFSYHILPLPLQGSNLSPDMKP